MTSRFLEADELTTRWGISKRTLQRWVRDQGLPVYRMGRKPRFTLSDVQSFEQLHRQEGNASSRA